MQANPTEWCTIESDPGVFTQLIEGIGVKNVQVEELYSLDDPTLLQELSPIHGLIFLFKWTTKVDPVECMEYYDQNLFFANQVIQNACATQAILSVLLNCDKEIDIGQQLKDFKQFTKEMDPQMKGLAISNSELIKNQHNSFARAEPFVFEQKRKAKEDDEVYHFIAYVPFNGKVYELDGLQKGPVILGDDKEGWVEVAKKEIDKRIKKYAENEIRFNLLAIIKNRKSVYENEILSMRYQKIQCYEKLKSLGIELNEDMQNDYNILVFITFIYKFVIKNALQIAENNKKAINLSTQEDCTKTLNDMNYQIQSLQIKIEDEVSKFDNYKKENSRRQHNYIPFILELLNTLGEKGKISELVENAKKKQEEKKKKKEEEKQKKKQMDEEKGEKKKEEKDNMDIEPK